MKRIKIIESSNLYLEAKRRYKELEYILSVLDERLRMAPSGKIHIVKTKSKPQYYLRKDAKDVSGEYISKREVSRIMIFLQKYYDEKVSKLINEELLNMKHFISKTDGIADRIKSLYSDMPEEMKKMIQPVDMTDLDYERKWLEVPYVGKVINKNVAVLKTDRGEIVRSKSELNIANELNKHGIPYRYECPLKLNNGEIIYPDFTILMVRKRKVIYWEHRGMMDDREYANYAVKRTKEMEKSGICLWSNLIQTEETSGNVLGTDEIEAVINWIIGKDQQ